MNAEVRGEKWFRELRIFLIQKFITAMFVIYVASQFTSTLYVRVFQPLMQNVLQVREIGFAGESIGSMVELLVAALWSLLSRMISPVLQDRGNQILSQTLGAKVMAPEFIAQYGDGMVRIYYTAIVTIIILQLVITILPYALMCWWYSKSIAAKVNEIRMMEKERNKEETRKRNLLFSDIVHDVKTPITTIVGYSRALNDGVITEEGKKHDYLNAIYMKSLRISELITMLFEFVKLDSEGFTLHKETLDLAELLRENVIALLADYEDKGLWLDFDIPDDICTVHVDRIQMSRVITNLLTNSIRYSKSGDKVFISMETVQEDKDYYLISVADSGLQIPRDFAEHIFEPFSRSDEARQTTSGGSGLGLSIAHKVAEMHGGELSLDLDYGNGYTKAFQIRVPMGGADATETNE